MNYYDLPPDLQESYANLDEESKQYPLVWTPGREGQIPQIIRFKANRAVRFAVDAMYTKPSLNDLWIQAYDEHWPVAELMQMYRMMGYSLCGFLEVFQWAGRTKTTHLGT